MQIQSRKDFCKFGMLDLLCISFHCIMNRVTIVTGIKSLLSFSMELLLEKKSIQEHYTFLCDFFTKPIKNGVQIPQRRA